MKGRGDTLTRAKGFLVAACLLGAALPASPAGAVKTSYWKTDSVMQLLKGDVVNVAIDSDGNVSLGPAWDSLATQLPGASYVWSLARDSKGRLYFGTGDDGKIYRWTRGRGAEPVWDTGASEITCMAVDAADNLYAGSTPGGVVFRVGAGGDTTRYFETGEESVWSLLSGRDGALYAGTGSRGRVFKITAAGRGEVYAETRDLNVLTLALAKDGALLAGTSSKGLLIRVDRPGSIRVLYDGDAEELRAIAVLADGSIVVGANRLKSGGGPSGAGSTGAVEVTPQGTNRCGVFLVQPDGSARPLYAPPTEWIYSILPADSHSVYVGTGEPAALFRVGTDRKYALLGAPESKQLLAVLRSGSETYVATGNAAGVYTLGTGVAKEGTFISEARDLKSVASWGGAAVKVDGNGEVLWSTRSGLSEVPDDGWSDWSREAPARGQPKIESPPARFLQYRLRLRPGGGGPVISSVEVAYLQRNLPPEISRVTLYGPAQPFFEGGAEYRPPQISQSFPDGMKLEFSLPRSGPRPVSDASSAWARGIRSVAWDATDPNGDDLVYRLYIKADDEKEWRPLAAELQDRAFSWDAESFANGAYRLRLDASDAPDNPPGLALGAERMSAPFEIDNVPPRIESLAAQLGSTRRGAKGGAVVRGVAVDSDTRITAIEYSLDGGDWNRIFPEDGIFDSLKESFRFELNDLERGEHSVTVRAADLDRNVAVAKVLAVTP